MNTSKIKKPWQFFLIYLLMLINLPLALYFPLLSSLHGLFYFINNHGKYDGEILFIFLIACILVYSLFIEKLKNNDKNMHIITVGEIVLSMISYVILKSDYLESYNVKTLLLLFFTSWDFIFFLLNFYIIYYLLQPSTKAFFINDPVAIFRKKIPDHDTSKADSQDTTNLSTFVQDKRR